MPRYSINHECLVCGRKQKREEGLPRADFVEKLPGAAESVYY
jgi:hypothetical protein